ncbi:MAG: DUF2927 domain-containing protein [Paracoccaceae bacterium]
MHFAFLSLRSLAACTLVSALAMLSACVETPPPPTQEPALMPARRSTESLNLEKYYSNVQGKLRSQGLLRTDSGGADAPYSQETLVEDFQRIALFDEYRISGGRFVASQTPSRLRRWEQPVRIGLVFGDLVPLEARSRDRANVVAYARRLSRISGLDIRVTNQNPNYHVLFMYKDELKSVGPELQARVPRLSPIVSREIANSPRNTFCVAYAFSSPGGSGAYTSAIVVIKAEHRNLMRLSCIHEEMAQALGLANDSPSARPSIFNDDEEFALLTGHDEKLLKMLYDPRLKLGMTLKTARNLLPIIAEDVMKGSS